MTDYNINLGHQVDQSRTVKTKNLPDWVKITELPDEIIELINYVPPVIQKPTDIKHTLHIEVDPNKASPFGLKGLPQEWIKRLNEAGLDENEVQNPYIVM